MGPFRPSSLNAKYIRAVLGPVGVTRDPSGSTLAKSAIRRWVKGQSVTNSRGCGVVSVSGRSCQIDRPAVDRGAKLRSLLGGRGHNT
jgi:hypothetical protein